MTIVDAIRYRVVCKYTGGVLFVLSGAFVLTSIVSAVEGEGFFIFYIALFVASALAGWFLYTSVPESEVTASEAAAIASISFLAASIIGALPFVVIGGAPPLDAWFESMSGFTTTGFSLLDLENTPLSLLFLRALSQWLGGMGFVVITVSLLLVSGRPAVVLIKERMEEKLFPSITRHVQVIAATYVLLTVLGVLAFLVTGTGLFDSICYSLSGLSTGGFAVHSKSIGGLSRPSSIAALFVMVLGSINFILYHRYWQEKRTVSGCIRGLLGNPQVIALISAIAVSGLVLWILLPRSWHMLDTFFLAVSAQTTTGYFTLNPSKLPALALMVLTISMFIGGTLGSTSGGIKLYRLIEVSTHLRRHLESYYYPREVVLPEGATTRGVAKDELIGVFYVTALYALFIFIGCMVFVGYGFDALESLFEVTSAVGTVGLSSGITGPELPWVPKVTLIVLMWAGRLEFMPLLVWLYSAALIGRRRP